MRFIIVLTLVFLVFISNVIGLGVVSDFLENDTMILQDGESKFHKIRIQNPTEYNTFIKLTYDDTYIKIFNYQEEYTILPNSMQQITFNVSVPEERVGQEYKASFTIHQLSGSGPGVPVLIKIAKSFKIRIVKDPNKFYIDELYKYIPIVAVILILILLFFMKELGVDKYIKNVNFPLKGKKTFKNRKIIKRKRR